MAAAGVRRPGCQYGGHSVRRPKELPWRGPLGQLPGTGSPAVTSSKKRCGHEDQPERTSFPDLCFCCFCLTS